MKKKVKQLITVSLTAVLLGGVYAGITFYTDYSEKKEEEEAAELKEASTIYLAQVSDPSELTVTNANGTFRFVYDEEEESWTYPDDERLPLLQTKVTAVSNKLASLTAGLKLENAEEASVYGLEQAAYTLTVTEEGKDPVTLLIGDYSEAGSCYYAKLDGAEDIYTAASTFVNTLDFTQDDLVKTESFPSIAASKITKLTVSKGSEETVVYEKKQRVVTAAEEESEVTDAAEPGTGDADSESAGEMERSSAGNADTSSENSQAEETQAEETQTEDYWEEDGQELSDSSLLETLTDTIASLSFENWADYYMEDEEKDSYGLGEDALRLTIYRGEESENAPVILTIGKQNEETGDYYVLLDDSRMVNLISSDSAQAILSAISESAE